MQKLPSQSRGVVLLLTLCGLTLLAAVVFLVYTLSDQVNRKIELQNTADSVAISSAGWYARSMNLIAQNNVTQARLLALVAVMDSIPLAAEMTVAELSEQGEQDNLSYGLERQLDRGVPGSSLERGNFLQNGLKKLYRNMSETDLTAIRRLDEAFDNEDEERETEGGYDVRKLTKWSERDNPESFWQVMSALNEQSLAAVDSIDSLAQSTALQFAQANNSDSGYAIPIDLPKFKEDTSFKYFSPVLLDRVGVIQANRDEDPGESYQINDIVTLLRNSADPVMELENMAIATRYGGAIPDFAYPHRLGPWANLYRWRHNQYHIDGGESYGASDPEIGRGFDGYQAYPIGYLTYGPVSWAIEHLAGRLGLPAGGQYYSGTMDSTRFVFHLGKLSLLKLAYMFGLDSPRNIQYADRWITDYVSARVFASNPENLPKIIRTRYYRVVVMSSVSWDSPQWMADSSTFYNSADLTPFSSPPSSRWAWDRNGWYDVASDQTRNLDKVENHIWIWKRTAYTDRDPRINIQPQYDDDGNAIPQPVYYCSWYVFGGIEIRDEQAVHNPCDWLSDSDLPRPIMLDVSDVSGRAVRYDNVVGVKVRPYSLVGVARSGSTAPVWTSQFESGNPDTATTAFARAEIFNSKSWDLWTQDWRVQLVPLLNKGDDTNDNLREWNDLVQKAEDMVEDQPSDFEDVLEYIQALNHKEMTDEFINH